MKNTPKKNPTRLRANERYIAFDRYKNPITIIVMHLNSIPKRDSRRNDIEKVEKINQGAPTRCQEVVLVYT